MRAILLFAITVLSFCAQATELGTTSSVRTNAALPEQGARDVAQFARDMKIDPNFKPVSYFRENTDTGTFEVEIAKFTCKGGFTVTLIPDVHVADRAFFEDADKLAGQADVAFIEGVRLAGFYGPPHERDDRLQTTGDYENRTRDRLTTISDGLAKYRAKFHRDPDSIFDFALNKYVEGTTLDYVKERMTKNLVDTWGHPFVYKLRADGVAEITSLGEDGKGTHPIQILNTRTAAVKADDDVDKLRAYFRKLASQNGLVAEMDVRTKTDQKATTFCADVTHDMLLEPTPLAVRIQSNQLRNVAPIMRIDDIMSAPGAHPKSFAITYGGAHMPKFEQYLTGGKFQCKRTATQWKTAISSPTDPKLTPAQSESRAIYIDRTAAAPATLETDPLGIEPLKN